MGFGGVRRGVSVFLQIVHKPLDICYNVAAILNLIFSLLLLGEGVPVRG